MNWIKRWRQRRTFAAYQKRSVLNSPEHRAMFDQLVRDHGGLFIRHK